MALQVELSGHLDVGPMLTGIPGQCPTGEMVKNPSAGFYRPSVP